MIPKGTRSLKTASAAARALKAEADPELARFQLGFMRARKGEYAEGDRFHGLKVPVVRRIARDFKEMSLGEIGKLFASPMHEERLLGIVILVERYKKTRDPAGKEALARFYLGHLEGVNHWDLVDVSAGQILGDYFLERDKSLLYELARSERLWTRRVAMIATQGMIRKGRLHDTFRLAELFLRDPHDLMHKAVGWMLREAGKKNVERLREFLDRHAHEMPRTMLRYSLEKLSERERRGYMKARVASGAELRDRGIRRAGRA